MANRYYVMKLKKHKNLHYFMDLMSLLLRIRKFHLDLLNRGLCVLQMWDCRIFNLVLNKKYYYCSMDINFMKMHLCDMVDGTVAGGVTTLMLSSGRMPTSETAGKLPTRPFSAK